MEAKAKGKDTRKNGSGRDGSPGPSASATSPEGLAGGDAPTAVVLQQRIAALKASRDKLIGAFDAQAAEVERLSVDNAALAEVRPRAVARAAVGAQDALLRSSSTMSSNPRGRVCGPSKRSPC